MCASIKHMTTNTDLLGLSEIADLYGVHRNTANNWSRQRDFPLPITQLKMGPVWSREEVVAWKTPREGEWISSKSGNMKFLFPQLLCPTCRQPVQLTNGTLTVSHLATGAHVCVWSSCENCGNTTLMLPLSKEDA